MTVAVILGVGAWFSEGLALWVILEGLNAEVPLLRAVPIYAAATLVGAYISVFAPSKEAPSERRS